MSKPQSIPEPPQANAPHAILGLPHPNSLERFAQSARRASTFRELRPVLREILAGADHAVDDQYHDEETVGHYEPSHPERRESHFSTQQLDLRDDQKKAPDENTPLLTPTPSQAEGELVPLETKLSKNSRRRIEKLNQAREEYKGREGDRGQEPILVMKIERGDGTTCEVIVGQSTVPQTIFNSSNVLIGVGLLGLPLGIAYAGWVIGLIFLVASAFLTKYTTGILAKCMDVDSSLANYADIAFIAFGEVGRFITSALFTFELMAANVALIILLAGTLSSLVPGFCEVGWKILCGIILTPTCFVPLRFLSYTSVVGVFAVTILLILIIVVGVLTREGPGSLLDVSTTWAFPIHWRALPLSFGLIMSPWGGQSVFPNIYRDMRHPLKYERSVRLVFSLTTGFDIAFSIVGFLMFGIDLQDEVTKSVLQTEGYPYPLAIVIMIMVAMIPITKYALNMSPIVNSLEVMSGIDPRAASVKPNRLAQSKTMSYSLKAFYRLAVSFIITLLAVLVPTFEMASAIMGAFFCFLICVILPIAFHLRMFWYEISFRRKVLDIGLIVVSAILGLVGTAWEFIPSDWIGIDR